MRKYLIKVNNDSRDIYDYMLRWFRSNISFAFHDDIGYYTYNEGTVGFVRKNHEKVVKMMLEQGFQLFNNLDEFNRFLYPTPNSDRLFFLVKSSVKQDPSAVKQKVKEVLELLGCEDNSSVYQLNSEGWCYEILNSGIKLLYHKDHREFKNILMSHVVFEDIFELYESLPKKDNFFFI